MREENASCCDGRKVRSGALKLEAEAAADNIAVKLAAAGVRHFAAAEQAHLAEPVEQRRCVQHFAGVATRAVRNVEAPRHRGNVAR